MTELVALLPLVQLQDRVGPLGPLLGGEAEVAEAVLGVLVLTKPGRWGAVARSPGEGLVRVHGGELVLGWRRATGEGVLSGWGAVE